MVRLVLVVVVAVACSLSTGAFANDDPFTGAAAPMAPTAPAPSAGGSKATATSAATPDPTPASAFFAGVRLGVEARSGDVTVEGSTSGPGSSSSGSARYTGHQKIPLTIDAGGRLSPNVTLGGYARLAAVLGGETDRSWSLGAVVGVLPVPASASCPWIAVAVGYQSLGVAGTFSGLEISPQVGLLFKVGHLTLGPIAELTLVDYSADARICSDCSDGTPGARSRCASVGCDRPRAHSGDRD